MFYYVAILEMTEDTKEEEFVVAGKRLKCRNFHKDIGNFVHGQIISSQ